MAELHLVDGWGDRMIRAVLKVRDRLLRATAALEEAGVAYAVIGGNAVAAWVATRDESVVRNTVDVDLLLRRSDFEAAAEALAKAGFVKRHVAGLDLFLDGPAGKARDAVHVVFAGERVRPEYPAPAPDVDDCETTLPFADESPSTPTRRILGLEALVRMKLTSYRLKDRVHLQDMLEAGVIDATWCERLPAELAFRLRQVLENPEGYSLP
ncbi:MAG: hypothetical protein HY814_12850 [Candidatus Riflebacteria bacterium]|nr:hypothetical protein [Candidatus Riflebacteria bacterium]